MKSLASLTHEANRIATMMPAATYGTTGLTKWLKDNAVTLLILVLALAVLAAARGGNISKSITIVAGLLVGLTVLGIASGSNASDIGDFIVGLVKS